MSVPSAPCRYAPAVPLAGFAAFGVFAALSAAGLRMIRDSVLLVLGVGSWPFPFLDTHAVLAAAECRRRGIDVYLANPCDVLGRVHAYSPLWLTLVPPGVGTAATPWIGAGLDLLFIASLGLLLRARTREELLVFLAAALSPATLYALDRANNDIVIFLLVLAAGLLQVGARRRRVWSYALIAAAALLKYYPAVLLGLAAREKRRDALLVVVGAVGAAALAAICYRSAVLKALADIPLFSCYTDSFSARNLPLGLASGLPQLSDARGVALVLFAVMAVLELVWLRRAAVRLDDAGADWGTPEARFAAIGALLLVGCFFAGQNADYRGIHFLFVLPGLLQLRATARLPTARRLLSAMIAAILFLMWEECIRETLVAAFDVQDRIVIMFWVVREWVWWWTIAGLAAVALCHLKRLPLLAPGSAWLAAVLPVAARNRRAATGTASRSRAG